MTKNTLMSLPSTVEGTPDALTTTPILPPAEPPSFDELFATTFHDKDADGKDTARVAPPFPNLAPYTPNERVSSVPFSVQVQLLLQQDSKIWRFEGGDGGGSTAAGTPLLVLGEGTPLPFKPRESPVKIIQSSSGDSTLPPMDDAEGWFLGVPTPKTRFRPIKGKRSSSGSGSGSPYLQPRETDFVETIG